MNRRRLFRWLGGGSLAALLGGGIVARQANAANRYYDGPKSDHFDGRVFFNPEGVPPRNFADLLKWQLGGGNISWPGNWPSPHPAAKPVPRIDGNAMRVTMIGHASLLIQTAGLNILTDPVWSKRSSPVSFAGPKRVNPPGVNIRDLPPVDLVLVSHNHYDHLDVSTLQHLHKTHRPLIVTPLGNDAIIRDSIADARIETRDWGEVVTVDAGIRVHLEPVHHWSARGIGDRRMALWSGFVVETPGGRIYHVGDTGFHQGRNYRDAAEKHGEFRLAILPIGAYEPRWFMKGQHQNPKEAVEGMKLCRAQHVAGHHWATFPLTNEAIEEPRQLLHAALDEAKVDRERFRPMLPGEVWDVPA